MEINGAKVPTDMLINALIFDKLNQWVWMNSKEGRKGHNPPPSLVEQLTKPKENSKVLSFDSGEDFDAAYQRIIGGN